MLKRWLRDLIVLFYWLKRDAVRRWKLDTPSGMMGIISLIAGLFLLVILGQSFAAVFRAMIPWVSGSGVAEVYWSSIGFGIKVSIIFLVFVVSVLLFFIFRLRNKP